MHNQGIVDDDKWHGLRTVKNRYPRIVVRCLEKAQPQKAIHRGMCIRWEDSSDGVDIDSG